MEKKNKGYCEKKKKKKKKKEDPNIHWPTIIEESMSSSTI
jgi:hypothetical protein